MSGTEGKPAGVHFDELERRYELWAYGHRVTMVAADLWDSPGAPPFREWWAAAAAERTDGAPRDLVCAAVALPGMERSGAFTWVELPQGRQAAELPPTSDGAQPRRLIELREARFAGGRRAWLGLDEPTRQVFYREQPDEPRDNGWIFGA